MSTINIICLSYDGTIREVPINSELSVSTFNKNNLTGKNKFIFGESELERECDYDYNDKFVTIFASLKGNENISNKHELPPPIDNNTYYGDIFALYHENEKLINMSKDQYKDFYETAFGGFEDLDNDSNEDDDDDNDNSDLDGFIVNDSDAETSDYHTSDDENYTDGEDDSADDTEDDSDTDDTDQLLEQYDVYKHYVDSMRKSGKSATKSIQDKLKYLYDELKKRNIL
jgi:hypothetical protein